MKWNAASEIVPAVIILIVCVLVITFINDSERHCSQSQQGGTREVSQRAFLSVIAWMGAISTGAFVAGELAIGLTTRGVNAAVAARE